MSEKVVMFFIVLLSQCFTWSVGAWLFISPATIEKAIRVLGVL